MKRDEAFYRREKPWAFHSNVRQAEISKLFHFTLLRWNDVSGSWSCIARFCQTKWFFRLHSVWPLPIDLLGMTGSSAWESHPGRLFGSLRKSSPQIYVKILSRCSGTQKERANHRHDSLERTHRYWQSMGNRFMLENCIEKCYPQKRKRQLISTRFDHDVSCLNSYARQHTISSLWFSSYSVRAWCFEAMQYKRNSTITQTVKRKNNGLCFLIIKSAAWLLSILMRRGAYTWISTTIGDDNWLYGDHS